MRCSSREAGGYVVSVRAPIERPRGAGALCAQFETGGGREGAGGINCLPETDLERFIEAFERRTDGRQAR